MAKQATAVLAATIIERSRGFSFGPLVELWQHRELLYFLVWRDLKVRYKQTALGAVWAILQPLLTAIVFAFFFGRLAQVPSDGLPYPLFAYAGLLAWTFFAQGVSHSAVSLIGSANLITKVYFPRITLPLATVLGGLIDLAVALPVLAVLMMIYRVPPGLALFALPLLIVLAFLAATGVSLWLSALTVEYRDVRYVVPFLVQLWLFLTPVIYPASTIAPWLERGGLPTWLLGLNPMAGVVEGFRWSLLGLASAPTALLVSSATSASLLLVTGVAYFSAVERSFADVV